MTKIMQFHLNISYDKYLLVYQGHASKIVATATDGRNIQFPAEIVKPYLTRRGIQGFFEIAFNRNNKFLSLKKIS